MRQRLGGPPAGGGAAALAKGCRVPVLANPKHELFAHEVAKGTPLEAAYVKAGYKADAKNAARLTKNDGVRTRIDEIMALAAEKAGITVERILAEMAKIAFSDIRKAIRWRSAMVTEEDNPDGGDVLVIKNVVTNLVEIIASDVIDDATAAAIAEISQNTTGGVKIKLHDKLKALVDLGKHVGMFKEKSQAEVDHRFSGSVELKAVDEISSLIAGLASRERTGGDPESSDQETS
jgi:phage terminase small subunit